MRKWQPFELSPEDLRIRGTPAQLAIAGLERARKASTPKLPSTGRPWKGATVTTSEVVVTTTRCLLSDCAERHEFRRVWLPHDEQWTPEEFPHHVERVPARVYRLTRADGSVYAEAVVRSDRKAPKL
jgi:hypothetical protein